MLHFSELLLRDAGASADGRAKFELIDDFYCRSSGEDRYSPLVAVVVPKGFSTDFASVPRFFWRIFPPTGKHNKAAVVHDWLYVNGGCTRFFADSMFRYCMECLGVPWHTRLPMYFAVRAFGWKYFSKARNLTE